MPYRSPNGVGLLESQAVGTVLGTQDAFDQEAPAHRETRRASLKDNGPLVAACMICGTRLPLDMSLALADVGWKYDFDEGWLCPRCSQRDLRQRRRRGPGGPMKGHEYS